MPSSAADLISIDPKRMGGVPCFRGTRVPISTVFGNLASGMTVNEILEEWPSLNCADVMAVLALAADALAQVAAEAA